MTAKYMMHYTVTEGYGKSISLRTEVLAINLAHAQCQIVKKVQQAFLPSLAVRFYGNEVLNNERT